ncbi:MAG: Rossmann-like domain-containing protein [Dehalococcoidia bacterium]
MLEAELRGSFGQAFTDQPRSFRGTIGDVQHLNLDSSANRAVFISTLNAVTCYLGTAKGTRHCRDDEPERCGSDMARALLQEFGRIRIALVGYQPAILDRLTRAFGVENVKCTDLNPKNIGSHKSGVRIWDGKTETARLIDWCELLLVTSSATVNNTFDDIYERAVTSQGKPLLVFGVTGAGVSALLGLKRICPYGH